MRDVRHPESLKLAATFFDDSTVVKEAQNAAMDIIGQLRGRNADVSVATLKQIIDTSKDKKITKRAEDTLKGLSKR